MLDVFRESLAKIKNKKFKKEFLNTVYIVVAVFAFRSTFFEPFRIPSGSMIPTLMIGDLILVNKFAYGFKVPFSEWIGPEHIYISGFTPPERGDVVVFRFPRDTSLNFVKRAIAFPGETVEVRNKVVYINGSPIQVDEFPGTKIMADMDENYENKKLRFYHSQTGEKKHNIQTDDDLYLSSYYPPTVVPKDHMFVMGDNRDHSSDSRFWGFVPYSNIRGKAVLVWFSVIFPRFLSGMSFKLRPHRVGNIIR